MRSACLLCLQAIAGVQPQKSRNVAFGTPKNNEIVPQPLRNFSHQAKPKTAASGAHPKRQSPSRFCVQAIAGAQPQKSRNVAFGTPKNNEIVPHKNNENVPQPLRNVHHQAKPKKAASGAHPKGRAPAGFASKPLQECSLNENVPQPLRGSATRQSVRKLRRERIRKSRAPAGFASKPLQECSLKNLETLLLEPLKTMKSCPSHCETSATRQSLRKLRRERIQKGRAPAGFASKPLQECNLKNLETLLLEPLKTMKSCPIKTMKTCLSHCETSATVGSASEKAEPQQVLRPSHCRSAASKISKRCVWNP